MKNSPCKLTAGSGFDSGKSDNIAATEPGLGVDGASSRPKLSSPGSPLTLRTMLVTILEIGEEEDSGGDDAERCVCAGFAACSDLVSLGSTKFDTGYSSGVEGPQPIPPSPTAYRGDCDASAKNAVSHKFEMPALLLFNTTRIRSGPLSTRASIAMDGGVADTARANTNPDATL